MRAAPILLAVLMTATAASRAIPPADESPFDPSLASMSAMMQANLGLAARIDARLSEDAPLHALDLALLGVEDRLAHASALGIEALVPRLEQASRNVETAQRIPAIERAGAAPSLADGIALARLATLWQGNTLLASNGLDPTWEPGSPTLQAHRLPSDAALALAARHGVAVTPDLGAKARELDHPDPAIRHALASLLEAFLSVDEASQRAVGSQHPIPVALPAQPVAYPYETALLGTPVPVADHLALLETRFALLDAALALHDALPPAQEPRLALCSPIVIPGVLSVDLTTCNNFYGTDFILLVDAGGWDTYYNNAGGSGGNLNGALFDFAGNDLYGDRSAPRSGGVNGGSQGGSGLLLDHGGHDVYNALDNGVNGGAWGVGAGLLLDTGGDDDYASPGGFFLTSTSGANGGGYGSGSVGTLIDLDGTDSYTADAYGVNGGGGQGGIGFLYDGGSGNDDYISGYGGANGGGYAMGVGFLFDGGGTDEYRDTTMGQGLGHNGGAWGEAVGFLFDAGGDDVYTDLSDEGANGGAIGLAVGMLVDGAGADRYQAGSSTFNGGGSNGGADLQAAAFLVDGAGNDIYTAGNQGVNGGADDGSVAVLVDAGGHDSYTAGAEGVNGGAVTQSAGFLYDRQGDDSYVATNTGVNGGGAGAAAGFLWDIEGNDGYQAGGNGANGGAGVAGVSGTLVAGGSGLLFDGTGRDVYSDSDDGTGVDVSVAPKPRSGMLGAQLDAQGGPNEDFESMAGSARWLLTGLWHVTARRSGSGLQSVWYGNEATGTYATDPAPNSGTATSPLFTVPPGASLQYLSWYATEASTTYDVKQVEISRDGGITWAPLTPPLSHAQNAWTPQAVSLAAYAGLLAQIRFKFDTIDGIDNAREGWYVDQVRVS